MKLLFEDMISNLWFLFCSLATFGRLIVIGMISEYEGKETKERRTVNIPMTVSIALFTPGGEPGFIG